SHAWTERRLDRGLAEAARLADPDVLSALGSAEEIRNGEDVIRYPFVAWHGRCLGLLKRAGCGDRYFRCTLRPLDWTPDESTWFTKRANALVEIRISAPASELMPPEARF